MNMYGKDEDKKRRELLREIILRLSRDENADELIDVFTRSYREVTLEDIVASSRNLDQEGLVVKDHVKLEERLFDLVKEKINIPVGEERVAGRDPLDLFRQENETIQQILEQGRRLLEHPERFAQLKSDWLLLCRRLRDIPVHYLRKENQLFPFLEKHGFTHPSTVMWAVHDSIRSMIKEFEQAVHREDVLTAAEVWKKLEREVQGMIRKEEMILFPTALSLLEEKDWHRIGAGAADIGFALVEGAEGAGGKLSGQKDSFGEKGHLKAPSEAFALEEGALTPEQVNLLLRYLPFDITYVDENDRVVFYNRGEDRIFPRSPGIIGREVRYCHPPKSVDVVLRILEAFRRGEKDKAEFWIQMAGKFIFIQYVAVRDHSGKYCGVLEITYDATQVRSLQGEQRLLSWEG